MFEYVLPQVMESRKRTPQVQQALQSLHPDICVEPSYAVTYGPSDIAFIVTFRGQKTKLIVSDTAFMREDPSAALLNAAANQLSSMLA